MDKLITDLLKYKNIRIPKHIGIICDGNGRWAEKKGLSRSIGHKAGANQIESVTRACFELGVEVLTLYCFSTENWNRPKQEINFLMKLFIEYFIKLRNESKENVKVKHIGLTDKFSPELINEITKTEKATENNSGITLNLALNYGGRTDITNVCKKILEEIDEKKLHIDEINEDLINRYSLMSGLPDADLIIRTSGEVRLSNFMLWQAAKADFWVTEELWPDFNCTHLIKAIEYYNRDIFYARGKIV